MRFAVIGGTGLIGSKAVRRLNADGNEAVPHSKSTGVDVITGEGLDEALAGADVVIDLTNSPTFDEASPDFFRQSVRNILDAGRRAGVRHAVALSIVGVDQVPELDYYRAKTLQEELLAAGPIPYSIVRATQFMEFVDAIMSWTSDAESVRLPATPLQPIAAQDVVDAVAEIAAGEPLRGIHNIAGPEVFPLDELGRITLGARSDNRAVITDDTAGMFAVVRGDVLTGGPDASLAPTRYSDWLASHKGS
ncbi:SDR family oxidoreductase [Streptomyces sp. NPDC059166]|uniref:SDR family oxidoreductase n=1 Tax=Streptomyces sp. NPDC059166 TaxID=3346752 RepID=UPI0036CA6782